MNLTAKSTIQDVSTLRFWRADEQIKSVAPAGESNMNVVLRVQTDQRSVIVKQSKPFVRKFPQIPAPIERIEVEFAYFKKVNSIKFLRQYSPELLAFYPEDHLLITGDLGDEGDFLSMYRDCNAQPYLKPLIAYLDHLHQLTELSFPENLGMRKLNHEHLFVFPFLEENGFDLDSIQPGLQNLSKTYINDLPLQEEIQKLGKRYLSTGKTLLHGDYYPGSWIESKGNVKVIDPEFAFLGDPEFDLGVFMAHGDFCKGGTYFEEAVKEHYSPKFDPKLANQYRGVEILRRLIGIAQLPLNLDLKKKEILMEKARNLILS